MVQRKLFEPELKILFKELASRILNNNPNGGKIYGIPRGGVPVAYRLLGLLNSSFSLTDDCALANIIVDDIIDSGRTKLTYCHNNVYFDTLIEATSNYWYVFPWEGSSESSAIDIPIRFLQYIGEDLNREGLVDTPKRVVKSWDELYSGYQTNPNDLFTVFLNDSNYDEMVMLKNIDFYSTCEHHLLPFYGQVHIAYIPKDFIVGISKFSRLVECFSRRLQVQERMTQEICNTIESHLHPLGTAVLVEAQHFCMLSRGVKKKDAIMKTCALTGVFKERNNAARMEFYNLIN